ncbi:MAG: tRNA epoxyqueuosine(34) reductase QueG [Fimbriimonadaceae bacterium]|nr:MAG: tRNA epoxyqueuosine(34) reductase QueG [Fimbriimonadaceae bacterium]
MPSHKVHEVAMALGFDLVGICDAAPPQSLPVLENWIAHGMHGEMEYMATSLPLRADLNTILPGVQSVIAVGLNYYQEPPQSDVKIARYALGRDYHKVIRGKLKKLAGVLSQEFPDHQWRPAVDSAPIMEREYANRAGLGWFGKNTCLINSHRGSWFFIGTLLTTAVLPYDSPAQGGCGTCRACIDACPTGAIVQLDGNWQVDARNCISYLTIEKRGEFSEKQSEQIGDWTFGCDICQEVCPFNQPRDSQPLRAQITQEPDFLKVRRFPSLQQLTQTSDDDWDELSQSSPIRRARKSGIERNALANLKNKH